MTQTRKPNGDANGHRAGHEDPMRNISSSLKSYYDSVREEAIPDRFLDLLERLDDIERQQGAGSSNASDEGGDK